MRSVRRVVVAVALSVVLAAPSAAQPEAFIVSAGVSGCVPTIGGTVLRVTPDAPAVVSSFTDVAAEGATSPYVTPDGRYLIWFRAGFCSNPSLIAVRDLVTGRTEILDVPGVSAILGNPARPEVYAFDATGVSAYGYSGVRRLGPTCALPSPRSISGDGSRLLFECQNSGQNRSSAVVDTRSGQLVANLPQLSFAALTYDGAAFVVVELVNQAQRVQKVDVLTGIVLADAPVPVVEPWRRSSGVWRVHFDERNHRALLVGHLIHSFDGDSLALVRTGPLGLLPMGVNTHRSVLDVATGRLYVAVTQSFPFGGPSWSIEAFDADTLDRLAWASGGPVDFAPVPKPPSPSALAATVTGSSVGLSWTPAASPPTTTRYVIEAGSAPGRADIVGSLDVGLQTSLSASGVPPGRYYVRVRAGNYAGLSAPSNEVIVQVP